MDPITVELLAKTHTEALFTYELENRAYFASIGFPRADSYYQRGSFAEVVDGLIAEQDAGTYFSYLVLNASGAVVGRVSFMDVVQGPLKKAELGYRIGQAHQGKGYATAAVRLAAELVRQKCGLHRLEAGTAPDNVASQIVLVKNGFEYCGRYRQYIMHGGVWTDGLLFEKILD